MASLAALGAPAHASDNLGKPSVGSLVAQVDLRGRDRVAFYFPKSAPEAQAVRDVRARVAQAGLRVHRIAAESSHRDKRVVVLTTRMTTRDGTLARRVDNDVLRRLDVFNGGHLFVDVGRDAEFAGIGTPSGLLRLSETRTGWLWNVLTQHPGIDQRLGPHTCSPAGQACRSAGHSPLAGDSACRAPEVDQVSTIRRSSHAQAIMHIVRT